MYSATGLPGMTLVGFPHSGISGSTPACGSPELFAANHALHRLSTPRHPPCALSSLTINPVDRFRSTEWRPGFSSRASPVLPIGLLYCHQGASLLALPSLALTMASLASSFVYSVLKELATESLGPLAQRLLMEETGLEPVTLGLQSRCSTN